MSSLSEAARRALRTTGLSNYEYQSDVMRGAFAQGRESGEQSGRAAVAMRVLTARFGPLSTEIQHRISSAPVVELDALVERLLTAPTLREALGPI